MSDLCEGYDFGVKLSYMYSVVLLYVLCVLVIFAFFDFVIVCVKNDVCSL